MVGETVAFYPPNAVQYRNAHDYLADFEDESIMMYRDVASQILSEGKVGKRLAVSVNNKGVFANSFPSPKQLMKFHADHNVLRGLRNTVLVITCNYPLNRTLGLLQRLYQPYFALTIFCGSWFPNLYDDDNREFLKMIRPFNYIHLSSDEMLRGYYAYYCMSKVKDLRLQNIQGNRGR
ncbi:hypothetical protein TELCIR_09430 [Teladorsagia circumcincta]|uniref:Uncharacterized protein n=1 Tax=Teladorsagia circumcincta TaxID=45464 RepID=A0A2G9UEV4_TELCI|nr:hypothetical protein TELCIR_09430 [Teladorsagia circumcincta]